MSHTYFVLCINHIYILQLNIIIIITQLKTYISQNLEEKQKYLNVCNQLTHKLEQTC